MSVVIGSVTSVDQHVLRWIVGHRAGNVGNHATVASLPGGTRNDRTSPLP